MISEKGWEVTLPCSYYLTKLYAYIYIYFFLNRSDKRTGERQGVRMRKIEGGSVEGGGTSERMGMGWGEMADDIPLV